MKRLIVFVILFFAVHANADIFIYQFDGTIFAEDFISRKIIATSTDAHTVIQAAINASVRGRHIKIMNGTYYIYDTIILTDGIRIEGENTKATVLVMGNNVNKNMFAYEGDGDISWFTLSNISLYGNKTNNSSGSGLYLMPASGGRFRDWQISKVFIYKFADHGIVANDAWGARMYHTVSEYNGGDGVQILGGNDLFIHGMKSMSNEGRGFFASSPFISISDSEFIANGEEGILLGSVGHSLKGVIVRNNSKLAQGAYDGLVIYGDNNRITDSYFLENGWERWSIRLGAGSENNIIKDNSIDNNAIFDLGTNNLIKDNLGAAQ